VKIIFDRLHKRLVIEKVPNIDEVISMNRKIMQDKGVGAVNYQSGNGFKTYVAKKYGLSGK